MQNREELKQKGHDESLKTTCRERGKKYHFQNGGNKYHFRTEILTPGKLDVKYLSKKSVFVTILLNTIYFKEKI
jgi:hypothetical protein